METLGASSVKLLVFVENQNLRGKHTSNSFWCQTPTTRAVVTVRSRPEIRFLGYLNKHVDFGYSSSLSFHRKTIYPVSIFPALSQTRAGIEEIQTKDTHAGMEEIQTKATTQFKTVHVKFQLQRECSFGQQFLVVGDDPMFGLWDPSNAIPLNWSEGHVWTVEMDVPCDKVIKYKFIWKRGDDTILWQPGPDRILRTSETEKIITVCEDWDNAELQTIIEEDPNTNQLTEPRDNPEKLTVVGNLLQPSEDPESLPSTNDNSQPAKKPLFEETMTVAVENKIEQHEAEAVEFNESARVSFSSNPNEIVTLGVNDHQNIRRSESTENFIVTKDEKNLDTSAAIPILVPGLTPKPAADTEESSISEEDAHINTALSVEPYKATASSVGPYKAQDFSVPELNLKEEPDTPCPISKEETETLLSNDNLEMHDKGHMQTPQLSEEKDQPNHTGEKDSVLDNDIHWGRRTLQQFLMNLGLL